MNTSGTKKIKLSITYKFIIGIALLSIFIVVLNSFFSLQRESKLLQDSMDQSGMLLASTLALSCQSIMISQQYDEFDQYAISVLKSENSDIEEFSIIDLDGKYITNKTRFDSVPNKLGKIMPEAQFRVFSNITEPLKIMLDGGNYVDYVAPIQVASIKYGFVILKYKLLKLKENKYKSQTDIIGVAFICLLAGVFLAIILSTFITKGLKKLTQATELIGNGDLSYRINETSNDEIGQLAQSFNTMLSTLEANNKALDRKVFEIETLFRASQAMNFQSDTDKLIKQILEMAGNAINSERCSIMLQTGAGTEELETKIVYSMKDGQTLHPESTVKIRVGEGVAGTVLKTGKSIIVNEGYKDPLFKSYEISSNYEKSIVELISVPLKIKDRVTGVINCVNKLDGEAFNEEDQRLLEALAQQAAMAVEHARLYELAITDGLTKLFINRYFQARLEEELVRAKRYQTTCSLILFDIDHFKKFNDTYGHQQGDIVLMEVAKLVKQTVRDTVDIPARYGGEEFVIILPETDANGALMVAERLRKTVEAFDFPGQEEALKVTISLGVASYPDHANTKSVLIKKADLALYKCKGRGRNCSTIWDETCTECEKE